MMEESKEDPQVQTTKSNIAEPLYVRYYSGHQGRFGHEFLGKR